MIKLVDKQSKFISLFDSDTGFYVRSGVIENGKDTGVDPFMTTYPQLIDVGIMGHCDSGKRGLCKNAGIQCYQDGLNLSKPNMTLDNFKKIVDESKGKVLQIALGGRGNPNKHENFKEILEYCRANGIVPNYTTSGMELTDEEVALTKKHCGAVAVSWQRADHSVNALKRFIDAGCKTNVHFVLGNFSIDDAIGRLLSPHFGLPEGINAVVFLAHKPVGLGDEQNVLKADDPFIYEFFKLIDDQKFDFKIGFDSCSVPGILNFTSKIDRASIDTCEGARWSMYISADMVATPCSFDQDHKWGVDLLDYPYAIKNAWDSDTFEDFRNSFKVACPSCPEKLSCYGGCPIKKQIVLCNSEKRK